MMWQRFKSMDQYILVKSALVNLAFMVLGWAYVIPGVSLFDLKVSSNSGMDEISYTIAIRGLFLALGNLICGLLSKYVKNSRLITVFLLFLSTCYTVVPLHRTFLHISLNMALSGIAIGILQVAISGTVFELWKKNSAVAVQILIFFYGVGSFITPLAVRPFLTVTMDHSIAHQMQESLAQNASSVNPDDLKIHYPYVFIAVASSLIAVALLVCDFLFEKRRSTKPDEETEDKLSNEPVMSAKLRLVIVGLAAIFYNLYYGVEAIYGQMLTAYVVQFLGFDVSTGALATTVFYGFYAFTRIVGAPLTHFLGNRNMMIGELLSVLVGMFLMLFAQEVPKLTWAAVAFTGAGVSLLNGTFLSYLNSYFPITSGILSIIFTAGCFGEFLHVCVVSIFYRKVPIIFFGVQAYCSVGLVATFLAICWLAQRNRQKTEASNKSGSLALIA